jgi:hypothetical protein
MGIHQQLQRDCTRGAHDDTCGQTHGDAIVIMFTNEQALELIKQHEECFVVWATDKKMIVAVHPIGKGAGMVERVAALEAMSSDHPGPTKGRLLSSASTTLQTLEDEVNEIDCVAKRVAIFNSWAYCPIDELIGILRTASFDVPMDVRHGSNHIVDRLYKTHGPHLDKAQLMALQEFAESTHVATGQEAATQALQCYLSVLLHDNERLYEFWLTHHSRRIDFSSWSAFVAAAGDLPTIHKDIIDQLVTVVERPFMFGPRYDAMVALGKIGAPAGPRAIQVMNHSIYDSSPEITAVRDRVIFRVTSARAEWSSCPNCFHGYVDGRTYGIPTTHPCSRCVGLGYLHRLEQQ